MSINQPTGDPPVTTRAEPPRRQKPDYELALQEKGVGVYI